MAFIFVLDSRIIATIEIEQNILYNANLLLKDFLIFEKIISFDGKKKGFII